MGLAGCIFIALTVLIVVQRRGASALLARFDNEQTMGLGI
jgi:hypothetical protein